MFMNARDAFFRYNNNTSRELSKILRGECYVWNDVFPWWTSLAKLFPADELDRLLGLRDPSLQRLVEQFAQRAAQWVKLQQTEFGKEWPVTIWGGVSAGLAFRWLMELPRPDGHGKWIEVVPPPPPGAPQTIPPRFDTSDFRKTPCRILGIPCLCLTGAVHPSYHLQSHRSADVVERYTHAYTAAKTLHDAPFLTREELRLIMGEERFRHRQACVQLAPLEPLR